MNSRDTIAAFNAAENANEKVLSVERKYDSLENLGEKPRSKQEREKGSKAKNSSLLTQAALNESYMAKNQKISKGQVFSRTSAELWDIAKGIVQAELRQADYDTWISPIKAVGYDGNILKLAVITDFNRTQVLKRHKDRLAALISELTDGALTFEIVVDKSLATVDSAPETQHPEPTPAIDRRNKWGMVQNPTNDPEVDKLLKRFGDMREVFRKADVFEIPLKSSAQGGWNLRFDALMTCGNEYGLARILWAVQAVKKMCREDRSITNPGGLFFHAVKKGLKPE